MTFLKVLEQILLKIVWIHKTSQIVKTIFGEMLRVFSFPDLELYCRTRIIKITWYWNKIW